MLSDAIVTLSCPDQPGIVATVAAALAQRGGDIRVSQQFGDDQTGQFFMRVHVQVPAALTLADLRAHLEPVADAFGMTWAVTDSAERPAVLLMASREGHCLNDLLYRWSTGWLPVEITAIVSNHETLRPLVERYGVPYHHVPVTPESREQAETRLLELVDSNAVDTVILARYMQIVSERVCSALAGRLINIHHSFLPGFSGAGPYRQAHERGVKLIGATAHYVTVDLDEGPIIEQDTVRVEHSLGPQELAAVGRDVECQVLARAVRWHAERRVFVNGPRTVIFR
ncbi:MAG: formyltetrahydrofolate deformylase [Pseudonocardiales bacterium]|nr:MAG: formyltetrahydrofolate deformylase [Pseudonocardiales bacterium]